ncbi:uncharacterized protein LOC134737830 [Pongo pygmaeus]|uniref:uncharacterized protein LOC134737830 n=1 Tax=Pongo pygmaeus TaxID=9600 RepID=UPI00300D84D0
MNKFQKSLEGLAAPSHAYRLNPAQLISDKASNSSPTRSPGLCFEKSLDLSSPARDGPSESQPQSVVLIPEGYSAYWTLAFLWGTVRPTGVSCAAHSPQQVAPSCWDWTPGLCGPGWEALCGEERDWSGWGGGHPSCAWDPHGASLLQSLPPACQPVPSSPASPLCPCCPSCLPPALHSCFRLGSRTGSGELVHSEASAPHKGTLSPAQRAFGHGLAPWGASLSNPDSQGLPTFYALRRCSVPRAGAWGGRVPRNIYMRKWPSVTSALLGSSCSSSLMEMGLFVTLG